MTRNCPSERTGRTIPKLTLRKWLRDGARGLYIFKTADGIRRIVALPRRGAWALFGGAGCGEPLGNLEGRTTSNLTQDRTQDGALSCVGFYHLPTDRLLAGASWLEDAADVTRRQLQEQHTDMLADILAGQICAGKWKEQRADSRLLLEALLHREQGDLEAWVRSTLKEWLWSAPMGQIRDADCISALEHGGPAPGWAEMCRGWLPAGRIAGAWNQAQRTKTLPWVVRMLLSIPDDAVRLTITLQGAAGTVSLQCSPRTFAAGIVGIEGGTIRGWDLSKRTLCRVSADGKDVWNSEGECCG